MRQIAKWLLQGDVSLKYQFHRDLKGVDKPRLRARIAREGWGAELLKRQRPDGHWGQKFYQPKWTSTHYTILDLKNLGLAPEIRTIRSTILSVLETDRSLDGGVHPIGVRQQSDVCLVGMFLNYASYFGTPETELRSLVDFLITEQMADGGFNCNSNTIGARHSSMHSTLSVLEGIREYLDNGFSYRTAELENIERQAREFLLVHRLFRSHRTGEVMDPKMLMLSYPSRWRYDVLRSLDYFRLAGTEYDSRMQDAMDVLPKKRRADGTWPLQARHSGQTHIEMEKPGQPSRWNTLRAWRVCDHFGIDI